MNKLNQKRSVKAISFLLTLIVIFTTAMPISATATPNTNGNAAAYQEVVDRINEKYGTNAVISEQFDYSISVEEFEEIVDQTTQTVVAAQLPYTDVESKDTEDTPTIVPFATQTKTAFNLSQVEITATYTKTNGLANLPTKVTSKCTLSASWAGQLWIQRSSSSRRIDGGRHLEVTVRGDYLTGKVEYYDISCYAEFY